MKATLKLLGLIVITAVIGFSMSGCGDGGEGGGEVFVAVTGITGVPTAATVGTPLILTGTVQPSSATNKNITWSLVSGDANLVGNSLTPNAAGTVVVKATIANGTATGTVFTLNFNITVSGGGNECLDCSNDPCSCGPGGNECLVCGNDPCSCGPGGNE